MILKEYQQRALATVRGFLEKLAAWKNEDAAARSQNPDWGFDWVQRAWTETAAGRSYVARRNGLGEQLPAFCLKIPTGGGKTLLATRVIDLVNSHFRQSKRGLVLWIVPTTQIYSQTLKALKDRDHPYRQQLDLSSGQRTLILEKTNGLRPARCRRESVRSPAHASVREPADEGNAAHVPRQRRLRPILPFRRRPRRARRTP